MGDAISHPPFFDSSGNGDQAVWIWPAAGTPVAMWAISTACAKVPSAEYQRLLPAPLVSAKKLLAVPLNALGAVWSAPVAYCAAEIPVAVWNVRFRLATSTKIPSAAERFETVSPN